jgi:hypothetical protein
MKFLVVTTVMPNKDTLRNQYFKAIHHELKKKKQTQIIWVVCQPSKIKNTQDEFSNIIDIHEFSNGLELMKFLNPDVIIVNIGLEPIQHSMSLAANHLNIPIISFAGASIPTFFSSNDTSYHTFRRFFSTGVPTDTEEEKFFMRRGKFMLYKLFYSVKTQIAIKINFITILKDFFQNIFIFGFNKSPRSNFLAHLVLLHFESQITSLQKLGFKKEKLLLIGHPLLDRMNEKSIKTTNIKINSEKIKLLIVTDTLFEHAIWTSKQRNNFFNSMFSKLSDNSNIEFALKIHPAQENKIFYTNFLKNLDLNISIFQSENLQDLIQNYDLILSFGASTTHSEISYSGKRLILLNSGTNLPKFPLVQEGIQSGHVMECNNIQDLNDMIIEFVKKDIKVSQKFIEERKKLFYKFDGKSAERGADAILNLVNKTLKLK